MLWSYGITCVEERFNSSLPVALKSLADAGFDKPRLFIDGFEWVPDHLVGYPRSFRDTRIGIYRNWILAMWELYMREPMADMYALFQDDILCTKNMRHYLEQCKYPKQGYLNLNTFPVNEQDKKGWYPTVGQNGLSALGLVFSQNALKTLLSQKYLLDRAQDSRPRVLGKPLRSVDGAIVTAMSHAGFKEYVHNPSLTQQQDVESTIGNSPFPKAQTFPGVDFDAITLLTSVNEQVSVAGGEVRITSTATNRVGLVGYNCLTGLGELNRQLATHLEIDRWLVKPHPKKAMLDPHPDVDTVVCHNDSHVEEFLRTIDTVLFVEQPLYSTIVDKAKRLGKRIVCIPDYEWLPAQSSRTWCRHVDLFICPTGQSYDILHRELPCEEFLWPSDTARFKFKQRTKCERFLFINGHGGFNNRKGADVIRTAKHIWPEMPVLVRSQVRADWNGFDLVEGEIPNNVDLYNVGDVLISPHSVDGLGLELLEAPACGMPVISTDGQPWNEFISLAKIKSRTKMAKVARPVTWYIPIAQDLVYKCQAILGMDISNESLEARIWAESRSWEDQENVLRLQNLVRGIQ